MMLRSGFAAFLVLLFAPGISAAATLSISPASGTYTVGDTFVVKVIVSSPGTSVNAVTGALQFSSSFFSVVSISKASSILNFWPVEPSISRTANTASFEGVSTNGFQGAAGTVVAVTVRALKPGTGSITFQNGQVLANDGSATDVTNGISGASITVRPAPASVPKQSSPASTQDRSQTESAPEPAVATAAHEAPPTLQAPVITSVTQSVRPGGIVHVAGSSVYPGAVARLALHAYDTMPVTAETIVGQDGLFTLTLAHTIAPGDYAGSVIVEREGIESNPSEAFVIRFEPRTLFDQFTGFLSGSGSLVALLMIVPFLLGMFCSWFLITRSRSEDAVHEVLREVDARVHKAFIALRASINQSIEDLENEKEHRALTQAEMRFIRKMTRTIKSTEDLVEREVERGGGWKPHDS